MTGLILIGVMVVWIWASLWLAKLACKRFKKPWLRWCGGALLFSVFLVAPLGDEIVGKYQFEALCRKYAVQYVDTEHARNRRVVFVAREKDEFERGAAVRIRIDPYVYLDEETKKIMVSFNMLTAEGGWFIRNLGISETNAPLLFNSGCAPQDPFGFQKKFNITVTN